MALLENGEIVEARIRLDGVLAARSLLPARLTSIGSGGRNAVATDERGREYLLPRGAPGITEGAGLAIEIVREVIPGTEPWKRPLARLTEKRPHLPPPLDQFPGSTTLDLPAAADALRDSCRKDLPAAPRSGCVSFA